MSEQILILDLETKPNETLRKLWEDTHLKDVDEFQTTPKMLLSGGVEKQRLMYDFVSKRMATDTDFCEVALICIKQLGGETRVIEDIRKLGEPAWVNLLHQMALVTFNGKSFDIPILIKQGLKHNLDLPYKRLTNACKKWGYGERHIDLMEVLAFGGRWATLDTYLQVYLGIEKKTKGDEFFRTASIEDLKKHGIEDIEYTEKLYRFFEKVL